jgi:Zn-dependent protease with chaperone function
MRARALTWQLPVVLALAAVWAVAAYFLWDSVVPSSLSLPDLDPKRFFSAHTLSRAADFEQFLELSWIGEQILLIAVFVAYARWGTRFMKESAAGPIGTGIFLAMMGFALTWFVRLPFQILDTWWERKYGVLKVGYAEVILGGWLGLGVTFLALSLAVAIVMNIARWLPRLWWVAAVPVFTGIALLETFVGPYLLGGHSLRRDDPQLAAAADRLQRQEGLSGIPVKVLVVHDYTPEENAFTTGIGPSRQVFVFDTLLHGGLNERQLETVLAHEFGHQARDHLSKEIAWYALFAFPEAYLIALATRRRGGISRPEAIPVALLVAVVFTLVTLPLVNLISRHYEAEADWMALKTTRNSGGLAAVMRHFGQQDLADPNPPTWAYILYANHPTLMQRIAMAQAWRAENR